MSNESLLNMTSNAKFSDKNHCVQQALLDRRIEESKLPEVYGVANRVVDTLIGRIGHSSLDIDNIASDLHYSKRTLQRRLRNQGYCFSELRDQVRRHYAIRWVLAGRQRIDDIYTALDFSDRSSLTLAFKRWTGFSPRAFGRLYRDYMDNEKLERIANK